METPRREPFNGSPARAKETATDIAQQGREAASEVKSSFDSTTRQAVDTTRQVMSDLKETGRDALKTCTEEGKKQLETIEGYVREYPVRSVLMGAAAGIFLGKLFRN